MNNFCVVAESNIDFVFQERKTVTFKLSFNLVASSGSLKNCIIDVKDQLCPVHVK